MSEFYIDIPDSNGFLVPFRQELGQDPHNGYLFLLAGGGIAALASFLLVLGSYAVDGGTATIPEAHARDQQRIAFCSCGRRCRCSRSCSMLPPVRRWKVPATS